MKYENPWGRKPSLEEIARALGGEICGSEVLAPGPGHSRADRSLSVKLSDQNDRGYVVHSFATDDPIECRDYVAEKLGATLWEPGKGHGGKGCAGPVIADYIYKHADGKPYQRVRRTKAKKFWQQRWTGIEWQNGAPQGPRIPYRLPELLAADPAKPVYIVEGEKDADRLASFGFVATTSSGGSNGKWTPELNNHFAGRHVRLIPDNDEPGAKYVQRIAEHLHGVVASLRIVELPGLGARTTSGGKDISDWLDLGNTIEALEHVAEDAPEWSSPLSKGGWRDHVFTAASLKDQKFDPISYVVPTLFPEGVTILAGRPKVGKSWLALDIALAIGSGLYVLGDFKLEEGDVLYAALEDNQRRLRSRIGRILSASDQAWPARLTLALQWRRLDAGGVDDAKEWAAGIEHPRLMIFDTLAGVRPDRNNKDTLYEGDYRALQELQNWVGQQVGLSALILHHTRKMESDDPIDSVSGSLGLTGCVDTVSVLARTPKGTTLYVRGRDVEEQEKAVAFDRGTCRWTVMGDAEEVHRSDTRQRILTLLRDASEPIGSPEIIAASDISRDLSDQTLRRMLMAGEIIKVSKGKYVHPERADLLNGEKS